MDKILRIDMGANGGPSANAVPMAQYAGFAGREDILFLVEI